nr:cytochrome P450 [Micromonospora sp. DSM 115978]
MSGNDLTIDLSNARFSRDIPFEEFAELRRQAPVFWYEPDEYWVVTSYELVREINRDFAVFSNWAGPLGAGTEKKPNSGAAGSNTILTMDPPQHTIYRRLVSSSFTASAVKKMSEMIRLHTQDLLKTFAARGGGDWVSEVAAVFPYRVMASLMGISPDDEADVIRRVNIQLFSDPAHEGYSRDDLREVGRETVAHADRLIEEHRARPSQGDLIDQLLAAEVDGQPLSQAELRAWVHLYIGAGVETTKHLLSNGLLNLLDSPEASSAVQEGRELPAIVEEMLRIITPVMHHSRWPLKDTEIGGKTIKARQRTTLWMISANRDETVFENPDRFDIARDRNAHDSFGPTGPHFCIGAGLARLETRIFLEELGQYLPRIELAGEPTRGRSNVFNVLASCPVTVN